MLRVLEHGGRLEQMVEQYSRPRQQWLDLSTGISPWSWPVPVLPVSVWQQLPNDSDKLESVAQQYYQARVKPLAVPGSQWLIRQLPKFLDNNYSVALPLWGYQEHALAWQSQAYSTVFYRDEDELQALLADSSQSVHYVVVINPNNPSGAVMAAKNLCKLEQTLAQRQGLLIVDEAFADSKPDNSLLAYSQLEHAVVLRSVGKFFGLAGIRLGFGFLPETLQQRLALECQPWAVSHPSRYIGILCLQDKAWHKSQRQRLQLASAEMQQVLSVLAQPLQVSDYFISLAADINYIDSLYQCLVEHGIYVRRFEPQAGQARLRFGLCEYQQLAQLHAALDYFLEQ